MDWSWGCVWGEGRGTLSVNFPHLSPLTLSEGGCQGNSQALRPPGSMRTSFPENTFRRRSRDTLTTVSLPHLSPLTLLEGGCQGTVGQAGRTLEDSPFNHSLLGPFGFSHGMYIAHILYGTEPTQKTTYRKIKPKSSPMSGPVWAPVPRQTRA